jgi:hypothetical protein
MSRLAEYVHLWATLLGENSHVHFKRVERGSMRDLKVRATATEEAIAGVNRRLDRLEMRVERIEKRLDLVEA